MGVVALFYLNTADVLNDFNLVAKLAVDLITFVHVLDAQLLNRCAISEWNMISISKCIPHPIYAKPPDHFIVQIMNYENAGFCSIFSWFS